MLQRWGDYLDELWQAPYEHLDYSERVAYSGHALMKSNTKAKVLHERYRNDVRAIDARKVLPVPPETETEVKSQHFVQRAYLEAFCSDVPSAKTGERFLWVHTAKKRWQATPSACATENYFYCHDPGDGSKSFLGETFLSDLEAASMDVLRAAQKGDLPTRLQDRLTLTGYVAMALARTPSAKAAMHHAAAVDAIDSVNELINDPVRLADYCAELARMGEVTTPQEVKAKLTGGRVRVSQTDRSFSLKMMAEQIMFFQSMFMRMNLCILHATKGAFVTSDRPVTVADPSTAPVFTDGRISHELVFPLCKNFCLIGTFCKTGCRLEVGPQILQALNAKQAREADRFVYAPFEGDFLQHELARQPRRSFAEEIVTQFG